MKTEKEIKEQALNKYADSIYPFNDKVDVFVEGAKCMQEHDNWKDPNIEPPELYQAVCFVVQSQNEHYNGKVYGGTYQGNKFGYHEFACPGIGFIGILWQPLPQPPKEK